MTTSTLDSNKLSPVIQKAAKDAVKLGKFTTYQDALEKISARPGGWLGVINAEIEKLEKEVKQQKKIKEAQKRLSKISPEQKRLLATINAAGKLSETRMKRWGYRSSTLKALIKRGLVKEVYGNNENSWMVA